MLSDENPQNIIQFGSVGERSEVLFFGRSCRMVFLWPLKITLRVDIGTNWRLAQGSPHVVKPVLRS